MSKISSKELADAFTRMGELEEEISTAKTALSKLEDEHSEMMAVAEKAFQKKKDAAGIADSPVEKVTTVKFGNELILDILEAGKEGVNLKDFATKVRGKFTSVQQWPYNSKRKSLVELIEGKPNTYRVIAGKESELAAMDKTGASSKFLKSAKSAAPEPAKSHNLKLS